MQTAPQLPHPAKLIGAAGARWPAVAASAQLVAQPMSRNAIEVYDPEILAKQAQLEVRRKMEASGQPRQRISADVRACGQ